MLAGRGTAAGGNADVQKQAAELVEAHARLAQAPPPQAAAPPPQPAWGQAPGAAHGAAAAAAALSNPMSRAGRPPPGVQGGGGGGSANASAAAPLPTALVEAAWRKLAEDLAATRARFTALARLLTGPPSALYAAPAPGAPPPRQLPFAPPFLDAADFLQQALPRLRALAALDFSTPQAPQAPHAPTPSAGLPNPFSTAATSLVMDEGLVEGVFWAFDAGNTLWEVVECVLAGREARGAREGYPQLQPLANEAPVRAGGGVGGGVGGASASASAMASASLSSDLGGLFGGGSGAPAPQPEVQLFPVLRSALISSMPAQDAAAASSSQAGAGGGAAPPLPLLPLDDPFSALAELPGGDDASPPPAAAAGAAAGAGAAAAAAAAIPAAASIPPPPLHRPSPGLMGSAPGGSLLRLGVAPGAEPTPREGAGVPSAAVSSPPPLPPQAPQGLQAPLPTAEI